MLDYINVVSMAQQSPRISWMGIGAPGQGDGIVLETLRSSVQAIASIRAWFL